MIFNFFSIGYTITKEVIAMDFPYKDTGNRIFELRKKQGLTRERLAEMSDISVQFLAAIEKGRKNMTVTTLRKLAAALMTTTDYIVNGKEALTAENNSELLELCKALPPERQHSAAKILRIFIEELEHTD